MTACSCAAGAGSSWWWPALFVVVTLAGGLFAALERSRIREADEVGRLRLALAVETAARRRTVAIAREWLPPSELAHALSVDPADLVRGGRW